MRRVEEMNYLETMPDRYNDEVYLKSILLDRAIQTSIANLFGCSQSVISQQLNPDNETHAWWAQARRFQWCVDAVSIDTGDKMFDKFTRDREFWRKRMIENQRQAGSPDTAHLICETNKQHAEFISSHISGKPRHIQIKELDEFISAALDAREGLLAQDAAERVNESAERLLGTPRTRVRPFSKAS